ncbi:MAG: cell wall metabolism sensor histidine kinase WalK, partial [bacterium]|nr:cell wall metabolism sensor histidine kinase WalK [bacterium]
DLKMSARDNVAGIIRTLENISRGHVKRETDLASAGKAVAEELFHKIQLFSSSVVEVMDMKTRGLSDEDLLAAEEKTVRPTFDSMMTILAKQNDTYKSELTVMREDVKSSQSRGQLIIVIIAIFAMVVGVFLSFLTERRISRPIVHLTRMAEDISRGDVSKPVEKESTDEIGELAE